MENFVETLNAVRKFAVRGDYNDWMRCLVCGIHWLPSGAIAVNTHQLRLLVARCKSSINGSLVMMGYTMTLPKVETNKELETVFPNLNDNGIDMRQWTVRIREDHSLAVKKKKREEELEMAKDKENDAVIESVMNEERIYADSGNDVLSDWAKYEFDFVW